MVESSRLAAPEDYVRLVREASTTGIPVKLGIEVDYIEGKEREIAELLSMYQWDYVIGSVHFIDDWGFDQEEFVGRWDGADRDRVYERYFDLAAKAAGSGLFDIIGHPDVIKVFGHKAVSDLTPVYRKFAQAVAGSGCAVEVSTAGLRKPVGEMYPEINLLREFRKAGVPIVISSDAHYPDDVGRGFDAACAFARSAGYGSVLSFTGRKARSSPLPSVWLSTLEPVLGQTNV